MFMNLSCLISTREKTLHHMATLSSGKRILTLDLGPCRLTGFLFRNQSANLGFQSQPISLFPGRRAEKWATQYFFCLSLTETEGVARGHSCRCILSERKLTGVLGTHQQAFLMEEKLERTLWKLAPGLDLLKETTWQLEAYKTKPVKLVTKSRLKT